MDTTAGNGPVGRLRASRHGAWRGAVMGVGYAAAVVAQAYLIEHVTPLAPVEVRPLAAVTVRWITTTGTALVGTAVAGALYLIVWRRHRRLGWAGCEGHRVVVSGFTCYLALGAITLGSRALSWGDRSDLVETLAARPPLGLMVAVPPIVFSTMFARAALEYRARPAHVAPSLLGWWERRRR